MTRSDAACSKTAAEYHPGFAPVGKQAPPARAAPSLARALRDARGALLFATGTKPDPTPQRGPFCMPINRPGRRNGPQPNKETAFRQWRGTSVLTLFSPSRSGQPLDTCGAIKERRTAFPLRTKKLSAKTKNNYLTGKAPYKFESRFLRRRVS